MLKNSKDRAEWLAALTRELSVSLGRELEGLRRVLRNVEAEHAAAAESEASLLNKAFLLRQDVAEREGFLAQLEIVLDREAARAGG